MKQIFTLITAMMLTLSIFAQADDSRRWNNTQSKITINTLTQKQVRVLIDGNNYSGNSRNNDITINYIKPGYHAVKIYQQKSGGFRNRKSYNSLQLVYDATIYVRPQYHIDIIINRFGKAFVDEREMNAEYYANIEDDHNDNNWNQNVGYAQPMNSNSFEQFKQVLRRESFDNTRLIIAKQTIQANTFTSVQIKDLLQVFSYEDSKLDIAEQAYKYVIDKNNYFTLNDAFAYSGSKEELARYIRDYK
ncbi:MAG: DUF4476 domain-containing protein [Ferruginibacter sp.]